jgi:hypothetical protein
MTTPLNEQIKSAFKWELISHTHPQKTDNIIARSNIQYNK